MRRIAFGCALFCVGIFIAAVWPAANRSTDIPVRVTIGGVQIDRTAHLDLPAFLWLDDEAEIRLVLLPESKSGAESLVAVTRLDLPGSMGGGEIREGLVGGQPASFVWQIRGLQVGRWSGKLWVWIESGNEREPVLVRSLEMHVVNFLGVHPRVIRWASGAGALFFPLIGMVRVWKKKMDIMLQ